MPEPTEISAQGLLERIHGSGAPAPLIVDVRDAQARTEWAIPGSVSVDAVDALRGGDLPMLLAADLPRDREIVLVCYAGNNSLVLANELRNEGYNAKSLHGGMSAWSTAWNAADVALPASTSAQVVQVRRVGKGCLSYLIGSGAQAAVIDPSLDPGIYDALAQAHGWEIVLVIDTHVHADHVSRARTLAHGTGARLVVPSGGRLRYDTHEPAAGESFTIGSATLRTLGTPGHTPESVAFVLDDNVAAFTGDTLFPTAVGRPDLVAADVDASRERATALLASLQALLALPTDTIVLGGHAEEVTGPDAIAGTIGGCAALVDTSNEHAFVDGVLAALPPTPPNHLAIVDLNEMGPTADDLDDLGSLEAGANRCAVQV